MRKTRLSHPIIVVVAVALCAVAALGAPALDVGGSWVPAIAQACADEAPKIFHGVGTITGVDAASGTLTVDHGDIPGLMDAMEMAYKVRPAALIDGLKKGDKIAFGVEGKSYTIVEIMKAP